MSASPQSVSAEDVAMIGCSLNLALPPAYVDTLVHYPFPMDSDLAQLILYADPRKVVERNEYRRKQGFVGHPWRKDLLIIGDFGNGDPIVLDTTRKEPAVLLVKHELSSGAADLAIEDVGMLLADWTSAVFNAWQEEHRRKAAP
jgi:hypothetical protein